MNDERNVIFDIIYNCPEYCGETRAFEVSHNITVILNKLAAYENTGLTPEEVIKYKELIEANRNGLIVKLPCKVGSTVFVIEKCKNIKMHRDNHYFDGTGEIICPYEKSCEYESCENNDYHIFETIMTSFWYEVDWYEEDSYHIHVLLEDTERGYMWSDFGKTIFLNREEAEAKMKELEGQGND